MYFLDTNVVIWLYQGETDKFSASTLKILDSEDLFISPLVKLELEYLFEVKRIKIRSDKLTTELYGLIGLQIHSLPLHVLIEKALGESWTRDPFDRMITAHARVEEAFLITKDSSLLKHYPKAVWK